MNNEELMIRNEFVSESLEHLTTVESLLVAYESDSNSLDSKAINRVFRSVHSIKGAAGFLAFRNIESLSHRAEEVLNALREGTLAPSSGMIDGLLNSIDRLKEMIEDLDKSESVDISGELALLERVLANDPIASAGATETTSESTSQDSSLASNPIKIANKCSPEALREFIVEYQENLEQVEKDLVNLERDLDNAEILNSVFRSVHTIKGSAGFLAFHVTESIAHAAESVLGDVRSHKIAFNSDIATTLFSTIDFMRVLLRSIEQFAEEKVPLDQGLLNRLRAFEYANQQDNRPTPIAPINPSQPKTEPLNSAVTVAKPAGEIIPKPSHPSEVPAPTISESTIRVDVALLDRIMTQVGELVLARNQILQYSNNSVSTSLQKATQRLNQITSELQESVMKTRMQPIGNVWSKFPRLVRDLASNFGKEVRIEMEGKDTELDKTIIEAIKDPLTHLVRNSIDHGIEHPDERSRNGKSREGVLYLRAFHESGQVVIEIIDDGKGLRIDRIRDKAIEKGLLTAESASKMSEQEISQLIFLPGFSTAERVSNVSGRGVGMDVVKTNIERIGGSIELTTAAGNGTTFRIKIPLTLAIVPALIVTHLGNRYAIPQANLLELVHFSREDSNFRLEWIQNSAVFRLRGKLLPIVFLSEIFKRSVDRNQTNVNIVVVAADGKEFGLVVDTINDSEEIVVKPLGQNIHTIEAYSGATIMGDGNVALILDIQGVCKMSGVAAVAKTLTQESTTRLTTADQQETYLVLESTTQQRRAVALHQVARLEKVQRSRLEASNERPVMQYRGEIIPLIFLDQIEDRELKLDEEHLANLVVSEVDGKPFGVIVHSIVDTQKANCVPFASPQGYVVGNTVINGRVTDVLDLTLMLQGEAL